MRITAPIRKSFASATTNGRKGLWTLMARLKGLPQSITRPWLTLFDSQQPSTKPCIIASHRTIGSSSIRLSSNANQRHATSPRVSAAIIPTREPPFVVEPRSHQYHPKIKSTNNNREHYEIELLALSNLPMNKQTKTTSRSRLCLSPSTIKNDTALSTKQTTEHEQKSERCIRRTSNFL